MAQTGNHTPGPWKIEGDPLSHRWFWLSTANLPAPLFEMKAVVGHPDEISANARLIAAAPELLEALNEAFDFLGGVDDAGAIRATICAAIAKAEGR